MLLNVNQISVKCEYACSAICWQEAAINVFSNIRPYLDDQAMRALVLPKAKALFTKATQVRVSDAL